MAQRVVIIGGDAGGMAAASQIVKGNPDASVVALEKGRWTSYSACGIPFLVGGEVGGGVERLVGRSPQKHQANGIDMRTGHEVMEIDVNARRVTVRDHIGQRTYVEPFDDLLIGTGGSPVKPDLPGIDLDHVRRAHTLDDAADLLERIERGEVRHAVVVGAGYIGLEMAEAFHARGLRPVLLDRGPQPLRGLDPDLGRRVAHSMLADGIDYRANEHVTGFNSGSVSTTSGEIRADVVVLGIGTSPNSTLAAAAGIELGINRAIRVDDRQATSVDGVWAAGDCAEAVHMITGERVHIALGTYANKQARVAGINIGGGHAISQPVLGTAITKVVDLEIATTGVNTANAASAGFDPVVQTIESSTRAGYYPGSSPMTVRLVFDRSSARLIGAQILGGLGAAKRIDTCAVAITAGMTAEQIVDLDLAYAPPFSPVWDPVAVCAREALKAW